jgi:hypothetical protein
MNIGKEQSADIFDLAAALGPNVVRFVPPSRDDPQSAGSEWAESLHLIDQAADFLKSSEERVYHAEARAEKIAEKAMEGLKTAHARVLKAEAQSREAEQRASEEVQSAIQRAAQAEAWAHAAEERAREAESRAAVAEARAKNAEEWLRRLTESLKQKLSFGEHVLQGPLHEQKRLNVG